MGVILGWFYYRYQFSKINLKPLINEMEEGYNMGFGKILVIKNHLNYLIDSNIINWKGFHNYHNINNKKTFPIQYYVWKGQNITRGKYVIAKGWYRVEKSK